MVQLPRWLKGRAYSRLTGKKDTNIIIAKSISALEPGWKPLVKAGISVTAICLVVNVIVLIWVHARPPTGCPVAPDDEASTLFCGSCTEAENIRNWSHLAINIVSTLMLAASTTCMQVLSAPTRAEVDKVHTIGSWMDIGILSFANLRRIERKRAFTYLVLLLSSVPIHFFYNSVVLSTQGVYDSFAMLATPDFLANSSFDQSTIRDGVDAAEVQNVNQYYFNKTYTPGSGIQPMSQVQSYDYTVQSVEFFRKNGSNVYFDTNDTVKKLEVSECLSRFQSRVTQTPVVMIITSSLSDNKLFNVSGTAGINPVRWSCFQANHMFNGTMDLMNSCYLQNWRNDNSISKEQRSALPPDVRKLQTQPIPSGYWTIDHCLVRDGGVFHERCSVIFSSALMSVVIFVNIAKLLAMAYNVGFLKFSPLVTVGDAVVSFMQKPDRHTRGMALHSDASIKASFIAETNRVFAADDVGNDDLKGILLHKHEHGATMHPTLPSVESRRWARAASSSRWCWTAFFVLCLYFAVAMCLGSAAVSGAMGNIGLRSPFTAPTLGINGSFLASVILTNVPQFLVSTFYVCYMGLLTTMIVAAELCDFTATAKAMRVMPSRKGQQRSTYFLQVPFRYSLPVLIAMMILHWLVSEALFVVRVTGFDLQGNVYRTVLHDNGYSVLFLILVMAWGGVICLFPVILGFRRLPSGLPLMNNNSLAISIACHTFADEPEDGHEKPLKYGLVRSKDPDKPPRIGFSAGEVERLTGNEAIDSSRCLSSVMYPDLDSVGDCSLEIPTRVLYGSLRKRL